MTSSLKQVKTSTAGEKRTKVQKIIKTIFLSLVWTCLGFYLEIYGPTQKDLKIKTHADYEEVALAVSGRSVGLFLGCLISGVLVDKFGRYCDLFIAICLNVAAIVTVAVPWSPGIAVLWVLCTAGGVVETLINVAGQRLILNMWLEKSAAPLHLLHGGYGIGSLLVPLYSNPFLAVPIPTTQPTIANSTSDSADKLPIDYLNNTSNDSDTEQSQTTQNNQYSKESRIEFSYAISASMVALLSVVFYYYQIKENKISRENEILSGITNAAMNSVEDKEDKSVDNTEAGTESKESMDNADTSMAVNQNDLEKNNSYQLGDVGTKPKTWREMFNPASCAGGRFWYGIQLLVLLFFYFANANGGERVAAGFVRSFSIDQLDFSGDDASYVNTSFWISHTLGRFIFFIAARWIGIRILVLIETSGVTLTTILLIIFAVNNSTVYWVLIQPLGFFIAPLWPSMIAWADHHIELTGVGMTMFLCAGGLGGLCHMRLMGYLYEHLGSRTFLYQLAGYGILALILTICLTIVGAQHGNRFKWMNKQEVEHKDPIPESNSDAERNNKPEVDQKEKERDQKEPVPDCKTVAKWVNKQEVDQEEPGAEGKTKHQVDQEEPVPHCNPDRYGKWKHIQKVDQKETVPAKLTDAKWNDKQDFGHEAPVPDSTTDPKWNGKQEVAHKGPVSDSTADAKWNDKQEGDHQESVQVVDHQEPVPDSTTDAKWNDKQLVDHQESLPHSTTDAKWNDKNEVDHEELVPNCNYDVKWKNKQTVDHKDLVPDSHCGANPMDKL